MKNEPIIRLAKDSDKDKILSLLNLVFNQQQRSVLNRGDEFWKWKYIESPFGKSILTVVEVNDEIIGAANLWPWEFACRGQILKALQPCDSAVHPNFRGMGLFKSTRIHGFEIAKKQGFDLIFNYPNKNSLPAYQSLGWDHIGIITWWVKILKPVNILKNYFVKSKSNPCKIDSEFKLDITKLKELSKQSTSFDGYIKVNRIENFYQWRYCNHPSRTYGMIISGKGYKQTAAIFTVNQNGNNREMVIVDFVGATSNTISLFKKIKLTASKLDADFIAVMDNTYFGTQELWKLGYVKKRLKNMVVLPINLAIENKTTHMNNWSLVAGMHDSI